MNNKHLLQRYCRDGDDAAFGRFYRAQADRLWRFLVARGSATEEAYDLTAEAFLRFIQVVCRDPRHPVGLLYRIAINLHIDRHRRAGRSPLRADGGYVQEHAAAPEADSEHDYLRELIQTLPEDEQNLLLMRYWIGMSHKEIALALAVPAGTVRRQCAAILQRLRLRWGEEADA